MEENQRKFTFTVSKDSPFVPKINDCEDALITSVAFKEGSPVTKTKFLVDSAEFETKETNEICELSEENKEENVMYIFNAEKACTFRVEGDGIIEGKGVFIDNEFSPEEEEEEEEEAIE